MYKNINLHIKLYLQLKLDEANRKDRFVSLYSM